MNTAHPTFSCPYIGSLTLKQMQSPVSTDVKDNPPPPEPEPVQQDDCGKEFYMNIINGSLRSTFEKYGPSICTGSGNITGAKSVVIVGAGVSGLSAAFELEKVGYHVRYIAITSVWTPIFSKYIKIHVIYNLICIFINIYFFLLVIQLALITVFHRYALAKTCCILSGVESKYHAF